MQRELARGIFTSFVVLIGFCASKANADVVVTDDGFSFSPNPVNIVEGEVVFWEDDGSGPYQIISDSSAWAPFDTPGGLVFNQAGTYLYHDDAGDFGTINVSPNIPPSVSITNPITNAVLTAPATFVFGADASDSDSDGLSDVEFYVGTNFVDDVFSSPFTTTVTNLPAGTYSLTVIAYDNAGATTTNSITIYVQNITLTSARILAGKFQFNASGLTTSKTNVLQTSTNLVSAANWVSIATNVATTNSMSFTNSATGVRNFFRLVQLL